MRPSDFTFHAVSGADLYVHGWVPDGDVRAIVQVSHGMQEHGARYEPVAAALCAKGFAVYAGDHRGHGKTAADGRLGHLGPGGYMAVLADLHEVSEQVRARHPGAPLFLAGHSWGSFLAQAYIQRWGGELAGCVLSGTNGANPLAGVGELLARAVVGVRGGDRTAKLLETLSVGSFNKPFEPGATGKEWLSRDVAEVRKYVDDPLCGQPFPNSFFLEMLKLLNATWKPAAEGRIPRTLPVAMIAGAQDPVGMQGKGVRVLESRYRALGLKDVTCRLYEGARHEVFNETNRDEVLSDLAAWLEAHLPA